MEELSRMTLEDISKEIGISRTTIYKVLKNKGNVSEETCRIVNEALEKYHYVQNRNARNLAMNRHYSIGYVGFRSKSANYFSTEVGKGLKRAVKEFGDDGLSLLISEFDVENPREQLFHVEEMLKQGVTSFILAYSHEEVIREILEKLKARDCLVVLLSRDVEKWEDSYYVGVDYYRSGRLAAELLGKMLPDGGKVFVPVTPEYQTNLDVVSRIRGFQDKIGQFPKVEVLPVAYGLMEEKDIYEATEGCIRSEKELKGIYDLTYRPDVIGRVLNDFGRKDIRLVGFDLFDEIRDYVEDSTIDAVIYQDLNQQAYLAVKILFDEMCYGKRKEEKKRYSKLEVIMQENIQDFK